VLRPDLQKRVPTAGGIDHTRAVWEIGTIPPGHVRREAAPAWMASASQVWVASSMDASAYRRSSRSGVASLASARYFYPGVIDLLILSG